MAITTWVNGLSSSTGPNYVGYKPTWTSGTVLWVDSQTGDDDNDGLLEELPKATLASAVDDAGTDNADTIIIKSGHQETLSSSQSFSSKAGLTIVGLGTGNNRPRFTCSGTVDMWAVNASNIWIENIYFAASTGEALSRLKIVEPGVTVKDCYFQCGTQDTTDTVFLGPDSTNCRLTGCTFVSTGTTSAQPGRAVFCNEAILGIVMEDCTFDGGSGGWSDNAVSIVSGESTPAKFFRFINTVFTGYSDMGIGGEGAEGSIVGVVQSGTGSVTWVP